MGIIVYRVFLLSSFIYYLYLCILFWVLYYCGSIKLSGDLKVSLCGRRFGIFFIIKKIVKFDWELEC